MARIDEYLAKILSSRYGRDVRDAIHDSIEEINNVNESNIATVQAIADTAQGYANNASDSADTAEQAVTDAQAQVTLANTARTGAETAEDGAEHFYQETLAIAQSLGSALIPKGTVEFADLPSVSSSAVKDGFMWNISDAFTTTSDFVEGAGLSIPMGANVYKVTINNVPKWDILAGSSAQVFTGTEAQIAQAIQQGLLGEGVMINSLDDGDDELLTTSMISHDGDSLENKLDEIDDSISQLDSDLGSKSSASAVTGDDAFSKIATLNNNLGNALLHYENISVMGNGTQAATANIPQITGYECIGLRGMASIGDAVAMQKMYEYFAYGTQASVKWTQVMPATYGLKFYLVYVKKTVK